jgi:hypothetical protein
MVAAVSASCTDALNRMYGSPSYVPLSSSSSSPNSSSRPDNSFSSSVDDSAGHSAFVSRAQQRVRDHIRDRCTSFVKKARTWRSHSGSGSGLATEVLAALGAARTRPSMDASTAPTIEAADSLARAGWPVSSLPLPPSAYSSAVTSTVPLVADRISLPDKLTIVPMLDVLPPEIASTYTAEASSALLRPTVELLTLNAALPLKKPRVAGSRLQYLLLLRRLLPQGMIEFTACPKAVNGIFAVEKDTDSERLIIDARFANRLFVDSPHVALPNPSHLVQLSVPRGRRLYTGKSDLSNFYHHFGLPKWMRPFFALPPLTKSELAFLGVDLDKPYPMCVTLPMGFSHAVYIAQSAHEHIVYRDGILDPSHGLLRLASPEVTEDRVVHGIVIDDFFLFSLNPLLAEQTMERVLVAYRRAGFVVKQSKVVMPTSDPVKVIGFEIDGVDHTIDLSPDSALGLVQSTLAALRVRTVSGTLLAHLVGRWTWVMLLRRPSLSVLQHVYRYCEIARGQPFTLWPSVRRELGMVIGLLPLLHARLDTDVFRHAIASDASIEGGGVVATEVTSQLHADLWPLCSNRHHAVQQTIQSSARSESRQPVDWSDAGSFSAFYSAVAAAPWRTIISKPWSGEEHINTLELRAALLAVHWCLSYPSALSSRIYLLLDSTVAFFALWKGRSSSPKMITVIRKINALLLAGGLSLLPGWIPSELNPADGPSRLRPLARPQGSVAA